MLNVTLSGRCSQLEVKYMQKRLERDTSDSFIVREKKGETNVLLQFVGL